MTMRPLPFQWVVVACSLLGLVACAQKTEDSAAGMPEFERAEGDEPPASDVDAEQTGDGAVTVETDDAAPSGDSEPVPEGEQGASPEAGAPDDAPQH
ncbi:MAG: hypothetical protein ABL957_09215 [Parvularculaceae bacterium]